MRFFKTAAGLLWISVWLIFSISGCGKKEGGAMEMSAEKKPVAYQVTNDLDREGQHVVALERTGEGARPLKAEIVVTAGANLISLNFDGRELLRGPDSLAGFTGAAPGSPVLYPTPNRVAGGKFSYDGRTFDFGLNDGDRFLHGLVRAVPWDCEEPMADSDSAWVLTWIDFKPGTTLYEKFGFDHRLSLLYVLDSRGLRIHYRVENRDSRNLPYGIAFHPYFNFLGSRQSAVLCVPAQWHMEAVNLMPTGKLEPLDGAPFDIRQPTPVPDLVLDDVYFGMTPDKPAYIEYREAGIRLDMNSSAEFTHMVVYIQPQNNFFCVENQTCSTDAHNLYARGLVEQSHLLFAPAGGVSEGWVHYILGPLK